MFYSEVTFTFVISNDRNNLTAALMHVHIFNSFNIYLGLRITSFGGARSCEHCSLNSIMFIWIENSYFQLKCFFNIIINIFIHRRSIALFSISMIYSALLKIEFFEFQFFDFQFFAFQFFKFKFFCIFLQLGLLHSRYLNSSFHLSHRHY